MKFDLLDDGTYAVSIGTAFSEEKIEIPATYEGKAVTQIASEGFQNANRLVSIVIPDSVTSVGEDAFDGCNNLRTATIPTCAIASIPQKRLESVNITSGTSIADYAFSSCWSLASITISDSVTSIGKFAFSGCRGLDTIRFEGTEAEWRAVSKRGGWNESTGDYTVICTDGTVAK